jgi:Glycosyltransferase family 87
VPAAGQYAVVLFVSLVVFLLACTFSVGGLAKHEWPGDVPHYQTFGERMMDGEIPYHDFYAEYPPGALPTFVLPAAISERHYVTEFKLLMAAFGTIALLAAAATLRALKAGPRRFAVALGAIAISPALLGHVFLNRYDLWPTALVSTALLALLIRRVRTASVCLALAVTAKIYAIAALPVAAVHVTRTQGRQTSLRALTWLLIAGAVVTVPFAIVAFGGLGNSFYVQSTRPLQIESLGASVLLVADQLGIYDARFFGGKANSIDLHGTLPALVSVLTSLLVIAAVLFVVWTYWRGRDTAERFVAAFTASIAAYVVFFKVLSPQYLTWLVPLVPLVAGTRGRVATVTFLTALLATQIEIYGFEPIHTVPGSSFLAGEPDPWAPALLLGRNLLLVAVFCLLLSELRALSAPRAAAARGGRAAARGSCSGPKAARLPSSSAAALPE